MTRKWQHNLNKCRHKKPKTIKTTKSPEAVAKVMDYLASEPVLSEFYARSLFVPGHLGIAAKGLDYKGASAPAKAAAQEPAMAK